MEFVLVITLTLIYLFLSLITRTWFLTPRGVSEPFGWCKN